MAFKAIVVGTFRERGRKEYNVAREVEIDGRVTDKKQAYEQALVHLVEDSILHDKSGTYRYKNMTIRIT